MPRGFPCEQGPSACRRLFFASWPGRPPAFFAPRWGRHPGGCAILRLETGAACAICRRHLDRRLPVLGREARGRCRPWPNTRRRFFPDPCDSARGVNQHRLDHVDAPCTGSPRYTGKDRHPYKHEAMSGPTAVLFDIVFWDGGAEIGYVIMVYDRGEDGISSAPTFPKENTRVFHCTGSWAQKTSKIADRREPNGRFGSVSPPAFCRGPICRRQVCEVLRLEPVQKGDCATTALAAVERMMKKGANLSPFFPSFAPPGRARWWHSKLESARKPFLNTIRLWGGTTRGNGR